MKQTRRLGLGIGIVVCAIVACSSDEDGGGTGGTGGASGGKASGGSSGSTGGSIASGGASGSGGSSGAIGGSAGTTGSGGSGGSAGGGGSAGAAASGGTSGSAGASTGGTGGTPDSGPPCTLTSSGAISTNQDGQVIELLRIESQNGTAIEVTHDNVVIRNVEIRHSGGAGIEINGANDVVIENVSIEHTGALASGANDSDDRVNIVGYQSPRLHVTNARLTRGSSGIYLIESADSRLSFIEGHDFRGPFPRGQLVQWDKSNGGRLEDFSVVNPPGSWPEDNVNVYQSTGAEIRRGLIDGNNSPSGVGVIFDGGPSTGVVEDVDAIRMGNGCFSDYDGGEGVVFRRTRCRENICTSQDGRGVPLSNALMWSGNPARTELRIEQSQYFDACNPGNIVWPEDSFAVVEVEEVDFTLRAPITASFCWE